MNPTDDQHSLSATEPTSRPVSPAQTSVSGWQDDQATTQQAVADLIRGQIDNIYAGDSNNFIQTSQATPEPDQSSQNSVISTTTANSADNSQLASVEPTTTDNQAGRSNHHGMRTTPPASTSSDNASADDSRSTVSAYQRTMSTTMQPQQPTKEQWQEYHSAWQRYYQLYYERYYLNSLNAQKAHKKPDSQEVTQAIGSSTNPDSLTQKEAMKELRENIRQKVVESSNKVKKSRHFKPILAGIGVLLLFTFLQYNTVMMGVVAAYVSPGNIDPQNIIVDPTIDIAVSPEPRMIIPKINVDAPVVYGIGPDYKSQMNAMKQGIAHFSIPGANAVPGQIGNAVFAAHSSNDVFASGDYKFVFAQNEKLTQGDIIYMNYEGTRYTYSVTSMEVVLPSEVSKVQIDTDKPMLTLVSCVPLGTAQKRLLVFAEQISPNPTEATSIETTETAPEASNIPGQPAPTLLQRLFGAS